MSKSNILVLLGGPSAEHDVSLCSGTLVVRNLDPAFWRPWPVVITRDRRWRFPETPLTPEQAAVFEGNKHDPAPGVGSDGWIEHSYPALHLLGAAHGAFLALHGSWGEDGRVQALLEWFKIPYTGSGLLGSASAMDKIRTKEVLLPRGIPLAPSVEFRADIGPEIIARRALDWGELPLVLKDPIGGSSIGVGIARTEEQLLQIASDLCRNGHRILCEKFLVGREVTCGVLDGQPPLPPTEIRPRSGEWFDFSSKYLPGGSEEITPAPFDPAVLHRIQDLARQVHDTMRLRVYSRTDMIVTDEGPVVLEVNTLPGLTATSLLPQQAAAVGIDYSTLLTLILRASWADG